MLSTQFKFLQLPRSDKWISFSPRRSKRPDVAKHTAPVCPFCPGNETSEQELSRVGGQSGDNTWYIRVLPNKFPFTDIHELIIHSPDHHKNIDEMSHEHVKMLLRVYQERYNLYKGKGFVSLFHNRGVQAGESIPHAHTQLAVVPPNVKVDTVEVEVNEHVIRTNHFFIFSPVISQWPDEVRIVPLEKQGFETMSESQTDELAAHIPHVIRLLDLRHGHEFPFNFIFQFTDSWLVRIIPRQKTLGGFELGTGIFVNTQDPHETNDYLKKHWNDTQVEILEEEIASYRVGV